MTLNLSRVSLGKWILIKFSVIKFNEPFKNKFKGKICRFLKN